MDEKEFLKERFKTAVTSAVKVISENFNLEIKFDNKTSFKENSLNLPEIVNLQNLQDFTNLRAFADSEALKIKYTDKKIYLENEPSGTIAKSLYAIAEKIRYEKIGSDKLKGIKNNITKCYENKFDNKKIEEVRTEADVPITEAFELYLRNYFFDVKQNDITKKVLSYWQDLFDKNLKKKLKELNNCIKNQNEFNQLISKLIDGLGFEDSHSKEKEDQKEAKNDDSLSKDNNEENNLNNENEKNQVNEMDADIMTANTDLLDENDNLNENETKEVEGNPSLQKKKQKKTFKRQISSIF